VELRRFPKELSPWEQVLELLGGSPDLIDAAGSWLRLLWPGMLSAPPVVIR
jgi:hypothetical protein